ncbi:hypothetical protein CAPTEDRAFT_203641 [Capitella teleta]|uniref:Mab-21-like nucleotidyltransferase domain-containing protein n=1 Tax=Capitella teleta TaxID=283909 RepID=R7UMQ3_CAPTE|nr:hypothetical protein CAPTEDRAFT_203641 [Capitella teleta]|eukprot:ELU07378.1 hypothetical protein CAPTEDRAFT_203641 [Capitella teleta]
MQSVLFCEGGHTEVDGRPFQLQCPPQILVDEGCRGAVVEEGSSDNCACRSMDGDWDHPKEGVGGGGDRPTCSSLCGRIPQIFDHGGFPAGTGIVNLGTDRESSHEDMKIRKPDEFDVLIPIETDDADWRLRDFHEDDCFVTIAPCYVWGQAGVLSAASIRARFQGAVQRFVNKYIRGYKLKPSTHGPAVTLDVYDGNRKLFSVDLVPLVRLEGNWLVAKPHPASVGKPLSPERYLWRRSFNHQEHDYIKLIPLESKKILMIVKAMVIDNYANGHVAILCIQGRFHALVRQKRTGTNSANVISFLSYLSDVLLRGTTKPFPDVDYHINILNNWNPTQLNNVARFWLRLIARPETKLVAATTIPREHEVSVLRQECTLAV